MERITLEAEHRAETGKGVARALRRAGMLPGVIYRGGESSPLKINRREAVKFVNSTMGEQVMVELKFNDGNSKLALLKDYQVDPVRNELLHLDFYEVSLEEKVRVTVGITLKGEPIGVKREGGILQQILREVEIECLPDKIPPHIEVDVTELGAGKTLHISEIDFPEDIRVLHDPDEAVATVTMPKAEAEVEEEEAVAEEEAEEPEVVKKGKKEEEQEAEE
ncbi:MAG: 50S ribosomal protein L25 [Nitrospirae bacterium]|nr:MAG: 50S ribosomal protein L25 [Nitrospirota bacterium]